MFLLGKIKKILSVYFPHDDDVEMQRVYTSGRGLRFRYRYRHSVTFCEFLEHVRGPDFFPVQSHTVHGELRDYSSLHSDEFCVGVVLLVKRTVGEPSPSHHISASCPWWNSLMPSCLKKKIHNMCVISRFKISVCLCNSVLSAFPRSLPTPRCFRRWTNVFKSVANFVALQPDEDNTHTTYKVFAVHQ